jgi:hypothetical protein
VANSRPSGIPAARSRGRSRADQVPRRIREPRHRQRGQPRPQVLPVPPVRAEQRLHPAPPLMTSRLRQDPAVRPGPRRQRRHVIRCHRRAALLRHHTPQDRPELGICSRRAIGDVLYAGHRGRVVVVVFRKPPTRHGPPGTPRCSPAVPASAPVTLCNHAERAAANRTPNAATSRSRAIPDPGIRTAASAAPSTSKRRNPHSGSRRSPQVWRYIYIRPWLAASRVVRDCNAVDAAKGSGCALPGPPFGVDDQA